MSSPPVDPGRSSPPARNFGQFAVVIPSLQSGETEAPPLFTQYNPHGLFFAGEAPGYLTLSVAFLFAAPVLNGRGIQRPIRWAMVGGFVLAVAAFIGFWIVGRDLIAFEVSVLSINWIVLIISGVLLSVAFRRAGRPAQIQRSERDEWR